MAMEKVDAKDREKIEAVRKIMRKQAPLSGKQVRAFLPLPAETAIYLCIFDRLVEASCSVCLLPQAKYCDDACVERFLRARGESVKKAAKHLRAALSWRETIGAGAVQRVQHSISTLLLFVSFPAYESGLRMSVFAAPGFFEIRGT